jgi:hypothetical protein
MDVIVTFNIRLIVAIKFIHPTSAKQIAFWLWCTVLVIMAVHILKFFQASD